MSRLTAPTTTTDAPRSWPEQLIPLIPGAGQDFIEQNLLWVLRDFCQMGLAWVQNTAVFQLTNGFTDYAIPTPASMTQINTVIALREEDGSRRMIWPVDRITGFTYANDANVFAYFCPTPGMIRLVAPIEETKLLRAMVSLVPLSIIVPTWFRDQHQSAIETGVMGRMNMLPNRPWTDQKDGTLRWRQYLNMRNMARANTLRAYTSQGQGWRFQRFGV
jgi:hypothetical protein